MGITIIRREGSKDRDRRIYERAERRQPFNMPVEGITRSVDEAHDIAYHRHGELERPFAVEGDSPEMKQAHQDDVVRLSRVSGVELDPDRSYREWREGERERKK